MTTQDGQTGSLDPRVLEIRRAILDRVATLHSDLKSLVGKYEGAGDDPLGASSGSARQGTVAWSLLQELLDYPAAVRQHIEVDLARASRPATQALNLRDVAKDVVEATSRIQQWFAAMHSSDVPSALEQALSAGIEGLEIPDQLGFIAAGNANQLDTVVHDARRAIFKDIPEPTYGEIDERRDKRPVAVFRSPHHEATTPRYWPIVLGHELAHLKLETDALRSADDELQEEKAKSGASTVAPLRNGVDPVYLLTQLDVVRNFDFGELERIFLEERETKLRRKPPTPRLGEADPEDGNSGGRHTSGSSVDEESDLPIQECLQTANDWVEEVVCDLFMVRKFGPAGVAAMANYLTAVGAYIAWTPTHPPGFFRIRLMTEYLGEVPPELEPIVAPWRKALVQGPVPTPSPWASQLMQFILSNIQAITAFVDGWPGERYNVHSEARVDAVILALRQLKFGLPPFSAFADSFTDVHGFNVDSTPKASVRQAVNASEELDESARVGSTVAGRSDSMVNLTAEDVINAGWLAAVNRATDESLVHAKVPIDRLSLKSIETLRLLADHPDISAVSPLPADSEPTRGLMPMGAILGPEEIQRRLAEPNHWRRIVVTPNLNDQRPTASLDLRLGNRFIVFQRTGISSFNAAQGSSPRAVQRLVERPFLAPFVLHPGEVVLAAALEYLALPLDIGAQVITRSAYGRLGLITATAVQVHPLYRGCLTLELVNLGTVPLTLYPGERVAQLVFFNVQSVDPNRELTPEELFRGSFVCPTAPEFPDVQVDDWIKP